MGKNNHTKSASDSPSKPKKKTTIVNFWKRLGNSKKNLDKKIGNSNKVKLKNNHDVDDKIMSVKSSRINSSRAREKIESKKKIVDDFLDSQNIDCYDYDAALSRPDIPSINDEKKNAACNKTGVVDVDKKIVNENVVVVERFSNKSSRIPRPKLYKFSSGLLPSKRISRLYLSTKSNKLNVKSCKRPSKQSVATNAKTAQVDVRLQTSKEKSSLINHDINLTPVEKNSLLVIPGSKKASLNRLCDDPVPLKNSIPPKMPKSLSWPTKKYSSSPRVKNRRRKFSSSSSSDDELSSSIDSDILLEDNYRSSPMKDNNDALNYSTSKIKQKEQHLIHSFFNTLFDIVFWPLLFTRNNRKK